ncbi:hypothetical protein B0H13DRAFT_2357957 [Mycena leptocephala]|nr:hypothetical protein B0H13DRAFT_2357957 [Mycena leptocephala]
MDADSEGAACAEEAGEDGVEGGEEILTFKAVCEARCEDPLWVKKCTATGPFDVFEPEFIRHALECEDINLGDLILWTKLHVGEGLPVACLSSNTLARFYSNVSISPEMRASWLHLSAYTYLFHTNKSDLRASHPVTILYRARR